MVKADLEKSVAWERPAMNGEPSKRASHWRGVAGAVAAVLGIAFVVIVVTAIWADEKDSSSDASIAPDPTDEPEKDRSSDASVAPDPTDELEKDRSSDASVAPDPTDESEVHVISPWSCNVSNLSFTETVYSNLRGLGPDTNSPQGLRFKNVHTFDNQTTVDLIVTLVSYSLTSHTENLYLHRYYKAEHEDLNGACNGFGCIHTVVPSSHLFSFEFVESITSKPTSLTEFRFTFFNEDDDFTVQASLEAVNRSRSAATWSPAPESQPFSKHSRYFTRLFHDPISRFLLGLDVSSNIALDELHEKEARTFSFMGAAAGSFGQEKCTN